MDHQDGVAAYVHKIVQSQILHTPVFPRHVFVQGMGCQTPLPAPLAAAPPPAPLDVSPVVAAAQWEGRASPGHYVYTTLRVEDRTYKPLKNHSLFITLKNQRWALKLKMLLQTYTNISKSQAYFLSTSFQTTSPPNLVPRPHPLTRGNSLVNQVKFLGLAHAFVTM